MEMERRAYRAEAVDVTEKGVLEGLVTPFGRETVIGDMEHGGFREEVAPGSFTKTLAEGDPLLVYQHDLAKPLARKSAGNLDMSEGEYEGQAGLVMRATPVDTSYARDLRALVKAKVIKGMSFGFHVVKDSWYDDEGRDSDKYTGTKRVIREVRLIEGSPVTRPAYEDTAISARDSAASLIEARQRHAEQGSPKKKAGKKADKAAEERGPKPYGDVPYADPKNGKYPIDAKHVKAAWSYINQKKNAAKYPLNGVTLASVKARIKAAMKKFGHSVSSEKNSFEFYCPEWRDDDPYLDDWYEIDADPDEAGDGEGDEPRAMDKTGYARMAAVLSGRAEGDVTEVINLGPESFCVILRDDPDGEEYACMRRTISLLEKSPPDVAGAITELRGCLPRGSQEPEASTPGNDEDEDLALAMAMRSREIELSTL